MKFNSKLTNNDLEVFIEVLPEGRSMKNVLRELLAARKVVEAVHETLDVNEWAQIAIALQNYDEVTR